MVKRRLLRRQILSDLPAPVSVPGYDSASLRPGIVHLGVGRFHRAHQAAYLDRLAENGVSTDWGVVGVGMRTAAAHEALLRQDGLFSVCEPAPDGAALRVVGHLTRCLFAPAQRAAVLDALADPTTKVVTLTITAPAYLQQSTMSDGAFALLAEALQRRRSSGTPPFTVVSCDNIADGGPATRRQVLASADRVAAGLGAWIDLNVAFPSTLVDRITPPLSDHQVRGLVEQLSAEDRCAVVTERFTEWLIEDDFCNDRPPLDEVGVRFVGDVGPYRVIKTRLLNGSHCALGFLGAGAGLDTTSQAMTDPLFGAFIERMLSQEVVPSLISGSPVDLAEYQRLTLQRISSTELSDPVSRLCARGSVRIAAYVLPSLQDALVQGLPHRLLTTVVAGWVTWLRRRPRTPDTTDPGSELLAGLAGGPGDPVGPLLRGSTVFGRLAENEPWARELELTVLSIERFGVRAAMAGALRSQHPAERSDRAAGWEGASRAAAS